jgi:predicted TIM-barrel fold metal-dependent hydrolase
VIVDAHQHFWNLEREAMRWMTDDHAVIRRTFEPSDVLPLLARAGVCGSDWPVALLNGDYERVWRETVRVIEDLAPAHAERLLAENASRLYALDVAVAPAAGGRP